ncbi:hypothetical protein DV515_00010105 [Chloebia gouldiae]|uniref:Uncharacterized protein n=1 Tax=Chloebia gouldiae TaxID=44316 RepID=A0A3L8SAT1_CHLGU|nr:hypothetical protein DV515_00010105 [Chloebia gouldiae]
MVSAGCCENDNSMQAVTVVSLGQLSATQCEKGLQNWASFRKCFRAIKSLTPTLASKKLLLSISTVFKLGHSYQCQEQRVLQLQWAFCIGEVSRTGWQPLSFPRAAGNKWAEVPIYAVAMFVKVFGTNDIIFVEMLDSVMSPRC